MQDNSDAVLINSDTAHRVARSVVFAAGGNTHVMTKRVRGEIKGYNVYHNGVVMSNDDMKPYI